MNGIFRLSLGDLWRGLVVAVLAPLIIAVLSVIGAVVNAPSFDVFSVDWLTLFHTLTNTLIVSSFSSASAYLLKNLITTEQGNVLGIPTKS